MQKTLSEYHREETNPVQLYYYREQSGVNLSQREKILKLLNDGKEHNCSEFIALGISQYGARIYELRKEGIPITNYRVGDLTFFKLGA